MEKFIVILIIALALIYCVSRLIKTLKRKDGCDSGCSACSSSSDCESFEEEEDKNPTL